MRIASTQMQQLFRAYITRLQDEYSCTRTHVLVKRSTGYEKVTISDEAKQMAAEKYRELAIDSDNH